MVKLIFSYAGYNNAFAVVNEIKVCDSTIVPFPGVERLLTVIAESCENSPMECSNFTYACDHTVYPSQRCTLSAATREEILASKQVAASIFFKKVFGEHGASSALDVLVCLSAFGNLIAVLVNVSRLLRETGRYALTLFMIPIFHKILTT